MLEWLIEKAIGKVIGYITKYTVLFPLKGICLLGNLIRQGVDTKKFLRRGLARAATANYSFANLSKESLHDINRKASFQIALPILGLCLFGAILFALVSATITAWVLAVVISLMVLGFFNQTVK